MIDYTDEIAKKYTKDREKYTVTDKRVFAELERIGIKEKDILDFGCGDLVYGIKFSRLGAKTVTGIDLSPAMIRLAKEKIKKEGVTNVSADIANGSDLPFPNNSFDLVFSNFVLHYFRIQRMPSKKFTEFSGQEVRLSSLWKPMRLVRGGNI
jgi:ubiquinone/menaquinone biosynthesis C-methylase UbiE